MTKKATSRKVGLKVLNDMVLIEEDKPQIEADKPSGLTKDVVSMINSGKLVIPDIAEFYVKKYPCTGIVRKVGPKVSTIKVDDKVLFARQGGLREKIDNKDYIFIRICDIHAVLD